MEERFDLRAEDLPIQLEQSGITVIAPGLSGNGSYYGARRLFESRAFSKEQAGFDAALEEAGLEDRHTLVLEAETPPPTAGGGRGLSGVANDEILMQVPGAEDEIQFAVYTDEAGVVSFHYPQPVEPQTALPSRSFGAAKQLKYRIPLRTARDRGQEAESRGFFGRLAGKVIKILVGKPAAHLAAGAVKAWENKFRAFQGLHGGTDFEALMADRPSPFEDLDAIRGRKTLLFVHGTTSSTAAAFEGLKGFPRLMETLYQRYEGRVLGFNHHTLGDGVAKNVRRLYDALAAKPGEYRFDIICHSRGGLVSRALSTLPDSTFQKLLGEPWNRPANVTVSVDRIVFVATPNAGTDLALPGNIAAFVDRMANYLNLLPDSVGTIGAGAILALASSIAELGLPHLPGLADQSPDSELLAALSDSQADAQRFYAFQADYEPQGNLIDAIKDAAVDRLFNHKKNDLVVPTRGVSETSAFTLTEDHVVAFAPGSGVHHTNFFFQPRIEDIASFLR